MSVYVCMWIYAPVWKHTNTAASSADLWEEGRSGGMAGGQNERELLLFSFIIFLHIVGSLYTENRFIHHFVVMDM